MDGQRRETLPSPLKIEASAAEDPWGLSSLHRTMVTARTDVATSTLWCAAVRRRRGTLSCRSSTTCSWRLTGSRARSCVRLALGDCKTGEGQAAFPASPGGAPSGFALPTQANTVTFARSWPERHVQVVLYTLPSVGHILAFADLDCTAMAVIGGIPYTTARSRRALTDKVNAVPRSGS